MTKKNIAFFIFLMCFLACTNTNKEIREEKTVTPKTEENTIPKEKTAQEKETQENSTKVEDPELTYLKTFVPEGYELFHHYEGDLNRDERKDDVILIAYKPVLEEEQNGEEIPRPCLILTRNEDGKLKQEARNDNAVLCSSCGGVFGDPYDNVAIKNGYFSTEHYGGSNWRWTQIITFKYDDEKKDWFLHKKGGSSYHTSNPDKVEEDVETVKDFGVVRFADYK